MRFSTGQQPTYNQRAWSKKMLVLGVLAVVVILGFIFLLTRNQPSPAEPVELNEYHDPASGETISDPEGKSPEIYGINDEPLVYLGFSKLLETGVSRFQADAIKLAFEDFNKEYDKDLKEVSIFVDTIKREPYDPNVDEYRRVVFDVIVNRSETYQAAIEYNSIRSARLVLVNSGSEIYRSAMIDPLEYDHHDDGDPGF